MIQYQIKLKPNKAQEAVFSSWLWHLAGLYNWAVRKIKLDASDNIYYSKFDLYALIKGHSKKLGVPAIVLRGTLEDARLAWDRCFKKISKEPRLKSKSRKLSSISLPEVFERGDGKKLHIRGLGKIRYFKQNIPKGLIKRGRILKRASGWYLSLWIDTLPKKLSIADNKVIGIDPGYKTTLMTSDGLAINIEKQFRIMEKRLAQAQRGRNRKLVSRIHERVRNRRKDATHKVTTQLTESCDTICFSKDDLRKLSRDGFGKSVNDAGHGQIRRMLAYKMPNSGRTYIEVNSRNSTKTCSCCGALTGPAGRSGLAVRKWACEQCGAHHDRDIKRGHEHVDCRARDEPREG